MELEKKRLQEQEIMGKIVVIYCRGQKHPKQEGVSLCPACLKLLDYANQRTARCPRMAEKSFCSSCPAPCYQPEMRSRVKEVMRYAGPRMLLHNPLLLLRHLLADRGKTKATTAQ